MISNVPKFGDTGIKEFIFLDESVRLPLYRLPAQRGYPAGLFSFSDGCFSLVFILQNRYYLLAGTEDRATQACDPSADAGAIQHNGLGYSGLVCLLCC